MVSVEQDIQEQKKAAEAYMKKLEEEARLEKLQKQKEKRMKDGENPLQFDDNDSDNIEVLEPQNPQDM